MIHKECKGLMVIGMTRKIYLDTGVIMLHFMKHPNDKIQQIYSRLKEGAIQAYILEPVLEEVAYHICVTYGKAKVDSYVRSFLQQYHITIVQPTLDLVTESGILKCKYRTFLSYYDALLISYCLKEKIEIHTTEKRLRTKFRPDIANKLKIIPYPFD